MTLTAAAIATAAAHSETRRACAPQSGDPDAKLRRCPDCGHDYWEWRGERGRVCPDCVETRVLSASEQMSQRKGPVYEKAVRSQLTFWTREAKRLGLTLLAG